MGSKIGFWIRDRDNNYYRLPVNPESITVSSPFSMSNVTIANLGEVAIPAERGLKTVSFSSFFPRDYNPSYCEYKGFKKPQQFVNIIEKMRSSRKSVRLLITGTSVSIPVFIDNFEVEYERAGHPGDIFYTISFVEFREVKAKVVPKAKKTTTKGKTTTTNKGVSKGSGEPRPTNTKSKSKTYTVKNGDTLWKIAKTYYKDGSKWKRIYDANKKVIGKNPNIIKAGQKLVIP